jgi:hypothetical protein
MKIFACFEGDSDIGAIEILMRKCAGGIDFEIESYTHNSLKKFTVISASNRKDRNLPKQDDQFTRILAIRKLLYLANRNDSKYIAYHQDADHDNFRKKYQAVQDAFSDAGIPSDIKALAIVPKEMTESWLLSDVKALNKLNPGRSSSVSLSPNPENLWGQKEDPESDYPKNYIRRNLEKLDAEINRDTYSQIAENSDIEVIRHRCPLSFGQFYADMQALITV